MIDLRADMLFSPLLLRMLLDRAAKNHLTTTTRTTGPKKAETDNFLPPGMGARTVFRGMSRKQTVYVRAQSAQKARIPNNFSRTPHPPNRENMCLYMCLMYGAHRYDYVCIVCGQYVHKYQKSLF